MLDITQHWYRPGLSIVTLLLLPFSWLYALAIKLRRWCYQLGICKSISFPVPIIIVGNITVGGTGKTPFVIWLAKQLTALGYKPGIVSRGYGGVVQKTPRRVDAEAKVAEVGDEAILLARNSHCPLVISSDRVAAVKSLLQHTDCDIVIADDGLQHYRLGATMRIALVDGERQFGNKQLLPAGPLREPMARLTAMDFVITQDASLLTASSMVLEPVELVAMTHTAVYKLPEFTPKKIHAVAGIGNPERFFNMLKQSGYEVIAHRFPDHYHFQAQDLQFADQYPIVMTEKDAVKCQRFANERFWFVRAEAKLNNQLIEKLMTKLNEVHHERKITSHHPSML